MAQSNGQTVDVLLVGAGVMSATLATLLKELDPQLSIQIVEMQQDCGAECSNPWNNAGTGHAGLCELNYTSPAADGSIAIDRAVGINSRFEVSKLLWAYLADREGFGNPGDFIQPVPHISFVKDNDIAFLKARHQAMTAHHAYAQMAYTEDHDELREWIPLMMQQRRSSERLAATRCMNGADVNFGALTHKLIGYLQGKSDIDIHYNEQVEDLERTSIGWLATVVQPTGGKRYVQARFVFLGAGGNALPLLQKSGIPEAEGYGGFPVSGQWLRCDNPEIVAQHHAKVYAQAPVGAPPMSVPHLDTRVVDGKASLLFGPYAGFTTRFTKKGSPLDLVRSVRPSNLRPMLAVAKDNMSLVRYLISEVRKNMDGRLQSLAGFYPAYNKRDWHLAIAGQRVQIIKKNAQKGGVLQFGTEIVSAADGTLAALLGASPGASVSVSIMLQVLERCFADRLKGDWSDKLNEIFPAREDALQTDAELYHRLNQHTSEKLGLVPAAGASA